jgi:dipeptidyl aminopeptidase/acylaminoacyl peptidase
VLSATRKILTRAAAGLVLTPLLAAVYVAARTAWLEYGDLRPKRVSVKTTPRSPQAGTQTASPEFLNMRDVEFRTRDGLELRGWYVPSRNRAAIVLVHGTSANRTQLVPEARMLVGRGYGVLLFDQRAHGDSEGETITYGERESGDVRAAVDFLSQQPDADPDRLGALGFSVGGTAVALAAASDVRIRAVVLEATITSMADACRDESGHAGWLKLLPITLVLRIGGIDVEAIRPIVAVGALSPRPLLVVHGDADQATPVRRAFQLFAAAKEPKELLIVRGAAHGGYLDANAAEYERAVVDLFDRGLRPEPVP